MFSSYILEPQIHRFQPRYLRNQTLAQFPESSLLETSTLTMPPPSYKTLFPDATIPNPYATEADSLSLRNPLPVQAHPPPYATLLVSTITFEEEGMSNSTDIYVLQNNYPLQELSPTYESIIQMETTPEESTSNNISQEQSPTYESIIQMETTPEESTSNNISQEQSPTYESIIQMETIPEESTSNNISSIVS